jgi:hypothetical protein
VVYGLNWVLKKRRNADMIEAMIEKAHGLARV